MEERIRHIIAMVFLPLLCGAFASCGVMDDEPCPEEKPAVQPAEVGFRIAVDNGYGSRALPGEDCTDEAGIGYENYIDMANGNFRFLVFDENNKYLEIIKTEKVTPLGDPYPQVYEVTGSIENPPSGTFRVVVLLNWPDYPDDLVKGETTIGKICDDGSYVIATFPFEPSAKALIPMYGVATCSNIVFRPNLQADLGQIDVLRAMAKVKVTCSISGMELKSVTLSKYNTGGKCAPSGMYDKTEYAHSVHIPSDVATGENLSFMEDDSSFIVYIPEYENIGTANPAKINVTLGQEGTDNAGQDFTIEFKDYSESNLGAFDILRNHYYQFDIQSVSATPIINYVVCPWSDETIIIPSFD